MIKYNVNKLNFLYRNKHFEKKKKTWNFHLLYAIALYYIIYELFTFNK